MKAIFFFIGKLYLVCMLTFASIVSKTSWGRTTVQSSVDPERSRNGENVVFKIRIENDSSNSVPEAPSIPQLENWEVLNIYQSSAPSTFIINGQITRKFKAEYSYILKPLKTGKLKIPSIPLRDQGKIIQTPELFVTVEALPNGLTQRPRLRAAPLQQGPNSFDEEEDFFTQQIPQAPLSPTIRTIPKDSPSVFVRGLLSKKTAYKGELLTLGYNLYIGDARISNTEIRNFPDLKGFLKEDLFIAKQFSNRPVIIEGKPYRESELVKYAIFPLKTGVLHIAPLEFRAEQMLNGMDIIQGMITGQGLQSRSMDPIQIIKTSEAFDITVKGLPAAPENAQFTGAVGQFDLQLLPLNRQIQEGQSFSLRLKISGRGNFKGIEEPYLVLPTELEKSQSKNTYEFHADTSGEKTFEYVVLARKSGSVNIPEIRWTYFDPLKERYVELTIPSIPLEIAQNAVRNEAAPVEALNFNYLSEGTQDWKSLTQIEEKSLLYHPLLIAILTAVFAVLGWISFQRRKAKLAALYFGNFPWEKTEYKINQLKAEKAPSQFALLTDQWIRERLAGLAHDVNQESSLHSESSREDYLLFLEQHLNVDDKKLCQLLQAVWTDLDLMRFVGTGKDKHMDAQIFSKGKNVVQKIIAARKII